MTGSRSEVLAPLYQDGCRVNYIGDMALAGPLCSSGLGRTAGKNESLKLKQVMRLSFIN
jgi:hypothetical protein